MADLTVQTLTMKNEGGSVGTAPNYQSWNDDDEFVNDGRTRLMIKGAASATGSVQVDAQVVCPWFSTLGASHSITTAGDLNGTGKRVILGPFPAARFNQTSGKAKIRASGTVTGVTIAVIKDPEDDGN